MGSKKEGEVKIIEAYKLTDGSIIEDKEKAEDLQKALNLKDGLRNLIGRAGYYTQTADDIYGAIINNLEEIREILRK